ncbi:MAG: septum formation protein Maf [Muribaculaceae bacterium]|nr:septum formation protein Maf [Muribaculaceae bacterium]
MLRNLKGYKLLLASASPRRKELLAMLGLEFDLCSGKDVDESYPEDIETDEIAKFLAQKKADAYVKELASDEIVITADTIVVNDGRVLGKPADEIEAKTMLKSLSGHKHRVITGVAVTSKQKQVSFSVGTDVEFATLDADEIDEYVSVFKPLDKAGAYGIQEWIGCIGVKNINGSYYNVMGLPLHRLYTELKRF